MKPSIDPLTIRIPRNITALMQHLRLLVGREELRFWCGGTIAPAKLAAFVRKMADRYPITRTPRQRTSDRQRGRAVVHLVAFPEGQAVRWWLLSSKGTGGLNDPAAPDAHVSRDAMSASHHVEFGDYVLLYATKRAWVPPEELSPGNKKRMKSTSTWTWKLRGSVRSEVKACIDAACDRLELGHDEKASGVRGILAAQRARPLFSGVRNQVIELHRYARDCWSPRRNAWRSQHPHISLRDGDAAGRLTPVNVVMGTQLPLMTLTRVYDDPPMLLRQLCASS